MGTGFMNYNPLVVNASGDNTITGDITLFTGGTHYAIGSDAGKLTIAGDITNPITGDPLQTRFMHLRGAGAGEISGAILTTGGDATDIVKLDAGTWTLSGNNDPLRKTTVQAGTLVLAAPLHRTQTVDVQGTSAVEVADGGGSNRVLHADTVTIAAGAKIDLRDNKLLTATAIGTFDGTAYSGIQGEVARAYNFGSWDLPGLTTSEELAGPNAGPLSGTTTIGVATGEQILFIAPTDTAVFAGQTVTGATTIAMYTYAGDMNFDGLVDAADYGVIDNWVQFPGSDGYANGDLNYDGVIDAADYGIIDNTIQLQGAPFPGVNGAFANGSSGSHAGVTAVPEPSAACGFAILAARLFARRRRLRGRELTL
jgi:autotransporter-associated beta strand protein